MTRDRIYSLVFLNIRKYIIKNVTSKVKLQIWKTVDDITCSNMVNKSLLTKLSVHMLDNFEIPITSQIKEDLKNKWNVLNVMVLEDLNNFKDPLKKYSFITRIFFVVHICNQ